jgi:hypothetical protein
MLYVDRGDGRAAENDAIFPFGQPLGWEAKDNNRSRTVFLDISDGGWATPDQWAQAIDATVDAMIKLEEAIKPHLAEALAVGDAAGLEASTASDGEATSLP